MQFTSTRVAASVALALGVFATSNSHAVRPQAIGDDAAVITPVQMPVGLSSAPVTVILQLTGNSVAEQQGAAGRRLDRATKDTIKAQLRGQQEALRPSIEALGGN